MVVSQTGGQFPRWYSDFLLFINICTKEISDLLVLWTNYGDIGPTIWRPLNQSGQNYMHGPLSMRVCTDRCQNDRLWQWHCHANIHSGWPYLYCVFTTMACDPFTFVWSSGCLSQLRSARITAYFDRICPELCLSHENVVRDLTPWLKQKI
jgi:hypothetical protein